MMSEEKKCSHQWEFKNHQGLVFWYECVKCKEVKNVPGPSKVVEEESKMANVYNNAIDDFLEALGVKE